MAYLKRKKSFFIAMVLFTIFFASFAKAQEAPANPDSQGGSAAQSTFTADDEKKMQEIKAGVEAEMKGNNPQAAQDISQGTTGKLENSNSQQPSNAINKADSPAGLLDNSQQKSLPQTNIALWAISIFSLLLNFIVIIFLVKLLKK